MDGKGVVACGKVMDCKEMKHEDLEQFSRIFALEFNKIDMHDRVLVFEILDTAHEGNDSHSPNGDFNTNEENSTNEDGESFERKALSDTESEPPVVSTNNRNMLLHDFRGRAYDSGQNAGVKDENAPATELERGGTGVDEDGKITEEEGGKKCELQTVESGSKQNDIETNSKGEGSKSENEIKDEKIKEKKKVKEQSEYRKHACVSEENEEKTEYKVVEVKEKRKGQEQENRVEGKEGGGQQDGMEENGKMDTMFKVSDKSENGEKDEENDDNPEYSKEARLKDINKHKLFVHSSWLAVQSPYFRALFYAGMKETHSKEVVIKVYNSELQAHLTLIEAMYNLNILNNIKYDLVVKVLVLANKYDVNMVYKKCKYVLISTSMTLEKCECIIAAVKDLPDCADLIRVLEIFLVEEFSPLDKTWTMAKFLELSEVSLSKLLSNNDLTVQSENTVFIALMHWMDWNEDCSPPEESALLSLVRFQLMTADFLCGVVRNHPIATRMPGYNLNLQKGLCYHCISKAMHDRLEDKPTPRPLFIDNDPTFSWIIDKNVRNKMKGWLFSAVHSSSFWCRVYEMQLMIRYMSLSRSYTFHLNILCIRKESCVNIRWTAKSKLFRISSISMSKIYDKEQSSWGQSKIASAIPFDEIPDDTSHTVDVWVKFLT